MALLDSYIERHLRISTRNWSKLLLNLSECEVKPEYLLGYQRHIRVLSTYKLVRLLKKCTQIGLRCDINNRDFIRAGLTEIVRRLRYCSNDLLDVTLIRDIAYVLKKTRFCEADTSRVSICQFDTCNNCIDLYGDLLDYPGNRILIDTVKLIGIKIIKDAYKIKVIKGLKYLNESAITPYFSVIGSLNLELSYNIRQLSILYRKCIIESKSLLNIATILQVLSKIGCRCGLLRKKLIRQLSYDKISQLLDQERSDSIRQIGIGQLLCTALYLSDTRLTNFSKILLFNLTRIVVDRWTFNSICNSLKSQLALYHSYIMNKNEKIDDFIMTLLQSIKDDFVKIMPKPMIKSTILEPLNWKTTVFQQQVSNLLKEMGYEIDCEVHIYPYIVDILVNNKIIIEVNGPCHYMYSCDYGTNTSKLNKNTILKDKLLTGSGYKVIHISYADWPSDKDSQINKLAKILSF